MRADEVLQSMDIVESLLKDPVSTQCVETTSGTPAPSAMVVTLNEAWRGGKIVRYKVKDPSFHNWNGLAMSLRDTGISDFPLNNKSYNLSYCGFDL